MPRSLKMCETEMWTFIQPTLATCKQALVNQESQLLAELACCIHRGLCNAYDREIEALQNASVQLENLRVWCETGKYPRIGTERIPKGGRPYFHVTGCEACMKSMNHTELCSMLTDKNKRIEELEAVICGAGI